ncbi:MAG TPA: imidazolonepropionase [Acidimicrobiia bacterium]|nr:imidazolonepropionase [Acidimicrobiia bacterium]
MTEPFVLEGIGELVTNDTGGEGPLGLLERAALVVEGDTVGWVGPRGDLPQRWSDARRIDLEGRSVIPGFVDAHTHLVFAGDRSDEFARRMRGESYQAIAAEGGGILATMAETRSAGFDCLVGLTRKRIERMLANGTTTIEIKSGYGLDVVSEVVMLRVAAAAADTLPVTLRRTFLGAHAVPPEYRHDRPGYVDLIVEEMLPACAPEADYCDVFVEDGAFNVEDARRIFDAASSYGLGARVHAEQLGHSGGAALAAEIGAASADHLDHATEEDAAALAASRTAAVLVPGASFQLRGSQAPGPMLWETGVTVALATDCNPGTSFVESMPFVVALGVVQMGLTVDQAVWAATRGGALALGLGDRGRLRPGDRADLVVLDAPSHRHLAYRPASPLVAAVIAGGIPTLEKPLPSA